MATLSTTTPPGFEILPLKSQPLGAEVVGLNLQSEEFTDELIDTLRKALLQYQVLVFRDQQSLTPARHLEFSQRFGGLYPHILDQYHVKGFDDIHVISNEVKDGKRVGVDGTDASVSGRKYWWHSDLSYKADPPMGSMLHMQMCPPPEAEGNKTLFANMYGAYDALDDQLKERIRGLEAIHVYTNRKKKDANGKPIGLTDAQWAAVEEVVHPVVRTHPETLRDCLFVSSGFTKAIVGLSETESEELLQELCGHAESQRFVYEHVWRPGDMVFWDNRCTMHLATGCTHPRTLHRTTIQDTSSKRRAPFLLNSGPQE